MNNSYHTHLTLTLHPTGLNLSKVTVYHFRVKLDINIPFPSYYLLSDCPSLWHHSHPGSQRQWSVCNQNPHGSRQPVIEIHSSFYIRYKSICLYAYACLLKCERKLIISVPVCTQVGGKGGQASTATLIVWVPVCTQTGGARPVQLHCEWTFGPQHIQGAISFPLQVGLHLLMLC